jgi:hypothetical protein
VSFGPAVRAMRRQRQAREHWAASNALQVHESQAGGSSGDLNVIAPRSASEERVCRESHASQPSGELEGQLDLVREPTLNL